jgi:hypothetical protein
VQPTEMVRHGSDVLRKTNSDLSVAIVLMGVVL